MKKIFSLFLLAVVVSLCGCSFATFRISESNRIEALTGLSFQYNEGTKDYSLFFGLLNNEKQFISAEVDVDIRIEDESGNVLYQSTKSVSKQDFSNYKSQAAGEQFLANVHIKASDVTEGTSSSGTVYAVVYQDDTVRFDEANCKAIYCLPTKGVTLKVEGLPVQISIKGYDGQTESIIQVEDFSYTYDDEIMPELRITISGTKIFGSNNSGYDVISYKLYDSDGFLVDSSKLFLNMLENGDKFKDDSITLYDIKPGEDYTLKFSE